LAIAVLLVALTSPPARRRWPRPARRIQLAIASLVVLVLAAATRPRAILLVAVVLATVGLLATWVVVIPCRLAPPVPDEVLDRLGDHRDRLAVADARVKLQNDLRTTALQAIAGLAVLAGAVLAFQQLTEDRRQATATQELTRQGQASERFTRAIDQLGSDHLDVRLGGIYALERIARDSPGDRPTIGEVLTAYLRGHAPWPPRLEGQPPSRRRSRRSPSYGCGRRMCRRP